MKTEYDIELRLTYTNPGYYVMRRFLWLFRRDVGGPFPSRRDAANYVKRLEEPTAPLRAMRPFRTAVTHEKIKT